MAIYRADPEDPLGAPDPYGPEDSPYQHWARRMVAPPDRAEPETEVIQSKTIREEGPSGAPSDGRRLRRITRGDEIAAVPLVVRLGGEAGSRERDEAREALSARVEAGELRMDAHERALLAERREAGGNREGAPDLTPFDELPREALEREVYCLYRPLSADPLDPSQAVVEQGSPMAVSREAHDTVSAPDPASPEPSALEGDPPVVAVIDDGIGFLNARFRRPDGRTRFDAVWLQAFRELGPWPFRGSEPVGFALRRATYSGAVLEARDIDHLLAQGDALDEGAAYRRLSGALQAEPGEHRALEHGYSHGTHVLDLAGGADPLAAAEPDVRRWPLLGVQLPPEAIDDTAGHYLQPLTITALRWVLWRARWLGRGPVVVTISLGALAGAKDGTKPIEWIVAHDLALFEALTRRRARVNWAFGNARRNRQVARFERGRGARARPLAPPARRPRRELPGDPARRRPPRGRDRRRGQASRRPGRAPATRQTRRAPTTSPWTGAWRCRSTARPCRRPDPSEA